MFLRRRLRSLGGNSGNEEEGQPGGTDNSGELRSPSCLTLDVGRKAMTAPDILQELLRIQPDFRAYWDGENYFRDDDGSFTACGAFSQFSRYFRERHQKMKKEEFEAVAALVSRCEGDDFLRESAYTCFLENIAGEPADDALALYISVEAREFMSHWRPTK